MRIVSKDNDYYDTAMAHGHDDSRVFVRKRAELEFNVDIAKRGSTDHKLNTMWTILRGVHLISKDLKTGHKLTMESFIVAFCGKLYPAVRVRVRDSFLRPVEPDFYCYDMGVFHEQCKKYGIVIERKDWLWGDSREMRFKQFFSNTGSTVLEETFAKERIALLLMEQSPVKAIVNPVLREIAFYKVFDAFSAYQELEMYFGNLAEPDAGMVRITDKDRIYQHGFDKWSFRTPPTKKRGRA